jgi:glycosyltransferase involved in cell wall biosynthesis
MKISLDISALDPNFKEHAQRGIGRYVSELKKFFDRNNLPDGTALEYFDHRNVGGKFGRGVSRLIDFLPAGRATLKQQLLLPQLYGRLGRDRLLHFPAHMDAPARGMPPYYLTVLDLIPQVLSDLYRAEKADWRFRLARHFENQSIRNASLLLCISECTAKDVNRILGVPWEKLRVVPLGIDQKFFEALAPDQPKKFLSDLKLTPDRPLILYVGGIDPRKNWGFALKVHKALVERAKNNNLARPLLVMAGRVERDREYPKLLQKISELGLGDDVKLLGYVEDQALIKLFKVCACFYFPSLYEGFGLPPLEAMAAGLAVVSSNTSCMPEVLGEAAILVSPQDLNENVVALESVLSNLLERKRLVELGKMQAKKFSWDVTGHKTLECYLEYFRKSA